MAQAFVLLVDDEPLVCGTASKALEHRGHKVHVMHGAREALKFFREHRQAIDIVVADIHMPDMSGPDMVSLMRQERSDLPVLFISGGNSSLPAWAKSTCGLLIKPFMAGRFIQAIEDCLAGCSEPA